MCLQVSDSSVMSQGSPCYPHTPRPYGVRISRVCCCLLQVSGSKIMSPAEREEYEDKRLKMRKAMGDKLHDEAAAAEVSGGLLHCLPVGLQGHGSVTDSANAAVSGALLHIHIWRPSEACAKTPTRPWGRSCTLTLPQQSAQVGCCAVPHGHRTRRAAGAA